MSNQFTRIDLTFCPALVDFPLFSTMLDRVEAVRTKIFGKLCSMKVGKKSMLFKRTLTVGSH